MAGTDVDIGNLALAHLGDKASIASLDPPEGSVQAEHVARFLPIARDVLLEMHNWGFATRRVDLALVASTSGAWQYQYRLPADCIKVLGVLPEGYVSDDQQHVYFAVEGDDDGLLLLTNNATPSLRYIARVTNPTRYPPMFAQALTWLLASYIAGPLLKGDVGAAAATTAWQVFLTWFARATASDAGQGRKNLEHRAPWTIARDGWSQSPWPASYPTRGF